MLTLRCDSTRIAHAVTDTERERRNYAVCLFDSYAVYCGHREERVRSHRVRKGVTRRSEFRSGQVRGAGVTRRAAGQPGHFRPQVRRGILHTAPLSMPYF